MVPRRGVPVRANETTLRGEDVPDLMGHETVL
jgi:hypothetical protein